MTQPSKPDTPIHPATLSDRAARIRATLDARPGGDYEASLADQAAILDALFRQLVLENAAGGVRYTEMQGLNLALRAQAQFRGIWQGLETADHRREKLRRNRRTD